MDEIETKMEEKKVADQLYWDLFDQTQKDRDAYELIMQVASKEIEAHKETNYKMEEARKAITALIAK